MMLTNWSLDKFRYYVVFSKEALFIYGLIFVHSFVENALIDILITHLLGVPGVWDIQKLVKAVHLQEGTSEVLQILFAFASDAYLGRFKMVVYSTISYIIGLVLFLNAARHTNIEIRTFYLGLVLITIAKAAKEVSLKAFLDDQFMAKDIPATEEDKERQHSRSKVWWLSASILGALAAVLVSISLKLLSMISAIAMVVAFLWFCLGAKFYERNRPTGSAISDVLFVIKTAVLKRNLLYATTPENLFNNYKGVTHIEPCISWLRWLDKAPIVIEEKNRPDKPCSVAQVKEVKFLLGMVPMWITFLTYSLVDATGSTFFLEQASNINDNFPITVFYILVKVTSFLIECLWDFLFRKIGSEMNGQLIMQGRIGIGMTFSVICCIFAWKNAVHWLYLVKTYTTQPSIHTDIFSLTPQFIFLGIMKGLSEDGLQSFFRSQVSESLRNYGPPFGECVIGIGKFLSVLCILIFSSWFGQDIDSSRLDNYYAMLTLLSFVNFLIYWLVAYWYGDDQFSPEVDCEPLIEDARDSIGPLALQPFSDQTSKNLQYISVSKRRTRSLSDKTHNNPPYFSVFIRRARSFSGPARPITRNRLDDAHEQENEQLLHIKIFDYEHRDVL